MTQLLRTTLGLFVFIGGISTIAQAEWPGSRWHHRSELRTKDRLVCTYDPTKTAEVYSEAGYLELERTRNDWFYFRLGSGCAPAWAGARSFPLRREGNTLLNSFGTVIGTMTEDAVEIQAPGMWSGDVLIRHLLLQRKDDGKAALTLEFSPDAPHAEVFYFDAELVKFPR